MWIIRHIKPIQQPFHGDRSGKTLFCTDCNRKKHFRFTVRPFQMDECFVVEPAKKKPWHFLEIGDSSWFRIGIFCLFLTNRKEAMNEMAFR